MKKQNYTIDFPIEFAFSLKMQEAEFRHEIKKMALIKFYELGKISSGKAAAALGITRMAFLEMLAFYKTSIFNDADEGALINDLKNA